MNNEICILQDKEQRNSISENILKLLKSLGDLSDIIYPKAKVVIKPNFVAPFEKAVTNLEMLEAVVNYILSLEAVPIIAESSGFEFDTDITFKMLGVDKLANKLNVKLVNLDKDDFIQIPTKNYKIKYFLVSKILLEADCFISMPKLKGHTLTKVTLGLKNSFGIIHRDTRRKIHACSLEKGIYELSRVISPDLVIVDGLWTQKKAVFSDAVYEGIIIAGRDVQSVDYICSGLLGVNVNKVEHIALGLNNDVLNSLKINKLGKIVKNVDIIKPSKTKQIVFKIYNIVYKTMYRVDILYSKITKGNTLIPDLHLRFGVRPFLIKSKCTKCGLCREECPVNCISEIYEINYSICKYVRCLKCINVCPNNAIIKCGLHKD